MRWLICIEKKRKKNIISCWTRVQEKCIDTKKGTILTRFFFTKIPFYLIISDLKNRLYHDQISHISQFTINFRLMHRKYANQMRELRCNQEKTRLIHEIQSCTSFCCCCCRRENSWLSHYVLLSREFSASYVFFNGITYGIRCSQFTWWIWQWCSFNAA